MKKNALYYLIAIAVLVSNCTKDADIELPPYTPILILHSYISPKDSGVIVYVNMSQPSSNNSYNDPKNVTNATVKISDGADSAILKFIPASGHNNLSYYFIDSVSFKI